MANQNQWVVLDLPPIDGTAEIGIAMGIDPSLPLNRKLRIYRGGNANERAVAAMTHILRNFEDLWGQDMNKRAFLLNAAAVIAFYSFIPANAQDGDCVFVEGAPPLADNATPAENNIINESYSRDACLNAACMIAATKVNWWQCNHHLGQETMQGYALKTFRIKYPAAQPNAWTAVVHTAGHWASTKLVLQLLGWRGIQEMHAIPNTKRIVAAADVVLRSTSSPAGVAPISVCHAAFAKIAKGPVVAIFPRLQDAALLADAMVRINQNPARYYMGSNYLTGQARILPDPAIQMIGRCGSYVRVYLPNSTLRRSPSFQDGSIENAPDYDNSFNDALIALRAASAIPQEVHQALLAGAAPTTANVLSVVARFSQSLPRPLAGVFRALNENEHAEAEFQVARAAAVAHEAGIVAGN